MGSRQGIQKAHRKDEHLSCTRPRHVADDSYQALRLVRCHEESEGVKAFISLLRAYYVQNMYHQEIATAVFLEHSRQSVLWSGSASIRRKQLLRLCSKSQNKP